MHVVEGTAVAVQFGPRKFYTGVVWRVHDRRPPFRTIKSIQRVLYDAPLLSAQQKALWEWIAAYYMCSAGEVMRVALPSLMKPSGDTEEEFAEDEFRPRTECYVALARELHDEGRLHEVFEKLGRRAPKQYEALLEIASAGDETRISTGEVARRLLRADYAVLHALERKGHIVCTERERTVERGGSAFRLPELTAPQREALGSLREQFAEKPAALLHGVTGSGKTEIYIHLIAETLARGGDDAAARARNRPDGAADRAHGASSAAPGPFIRNTNRRRTGDLPAAEPFPKGASSSSACGRHFCRSGICS